MSQMTANWPPRIFSPVGEYQAWDTLFKQQVPASMTDLLKNPNVPPMEKPKRPESFVIMDENGPSGMSTPSAGSRENLYKQYKLQAKVHLELKMWVHNTLSQDFRKTCCPEDETAFQWRMNVVRRLRDVLKESAGAQVTNQGKSSSDIASLMPCQRLMHITQESPIPSNRLLPMTMKTTGHRGRNAKLIA
jgi:hypothetical protein